MWSIAVSALVAAAMGCVVPRGPIGPAPSPDAFARAAHPDPAIRITAIGNLSLDPDPRAVRMLLTLLQRDVAPEVRAAAARAIELRRDTTLDAALQTASTLDPDPSVRAAAAASHAKLWAWTRRPGSAAAWSTLCPGCGQIYLGKPEVGVAQLATVVALIGGGASLIQDSSGLGGPVSSSRTPVGLALLIAGQNMWFYSIFDAYRDARVLRGDTGYAHSITHERLDDLLLAPFTPRVLASPWVWGGVPLMLAAGLGLSYFVSKDEFTGRSIADVDHINFLGNRLSRGAGFAAGEAYYVSLFDPVGVGEEALFRGLIQTELDERLGTWGGLVTSSAIFGSVHALNFVQPGADPYVALYAVPFISVVGSMLGLAYIRTGYKLETSVAMHFWYDFLLSTAAFAVDPEHQPFVVEYGAAF